ncbi:MAG: hypothetical protein GY841_23515 [FCB group bacterium]|nr:hypothetical protein [FCB group bacterium]
MGKIIIYRDIDDDGESFTVYRHHIDGDSEYLGIFLADDQTLKDYIEQAAGVTEGLDNRSNQTPELGPNLFQICLRLEAKIWGQWCEDSAKYHEQTGLERLYNLIEINNHRQAMMNRRATEAGTTPQKLLV